MSKRQEIRERRRKQQHRQRILIIGMVVAGALLIAFALIWPTLKGNQAANDALASITPIAPLAINAAMNGTHLGDPNATVKMDVWEDFQCSGCFYYTNNIEPLVIQNDVETGKVYYTFHFYPFISSGTSGESQQSANAAMCALEQGHFWDYHKILFTNWIGENAGSFTDARLVAMATSISLDMTAFNKCFQANPYADQINQDFQAGKDMGVGATPAIFINGKTAESSAGAKYIPSFDDLSRIIDGLLSEQ
jgi:protein-disulfide isomerase